MRIFKTAPWLLGLLGIVFAGTTYAESTEELIVTAAKREQTKPSALRGQQEEAHHAGEDLWPRNTSLEPTTDDASRTPSSFRLRLRTVSGARATHAADSSVRPRPGARPSFSTSRPPMKWRAKHR